jgi:rRNA maturation endonuclease Nob1
MAEEYTLLCKQCRNVFKSALQPGSSVDGKVCCPKCQGLVVIEAPVWAPLGSGSNIFEDSTWEYQCQQCRHTFKLPIPRSPSEDKNRRCPSCGGGHLHLITDIGAQPLYCG